MGQLPVIVLVIALVVGSEAQNIGTKCRKDNREGVCIKIESCPSLLTLLRQIRSGSAPSGSLNELRRSLCAFITEPLVCCTSFSSATPSRPDGPQVSGDSLLPSQCGVSALTDRIIDGEAAPLLAWPWMVLFAGTKNSDGGFIFFCGGVLISERYVLSAAHCFKSSNNIRQVVARVGEHTLSTNPDCEGGRCAPTPQDIPIERVINHPDYQRGCRSCNDIALVRLSRPAVLDVLFVVPICLPRNPVQDLGFSVQQYRGKLGWAAGWGLISRDSRQSLRPDVLQQVQLPIQDSADCQRRTSSNPNPNSVLCAGGDGRDTCRGDSGGPLTLGSTLSSRTYVVGLTSHGPLECGTPNTQGVYTSVNYYVDWIISNLQP